MPSTSGSETWPQWASRSSCARLAPKGAGRSRSSPVRRTIDACSTSGPSLNTASRCAGARSAATIVAPAASAASAIGW